MTSLEHFPSTRSQRRVLQNHELGPHRVLDVCLRSLKPPKMSVFSHCLEPTSAQQFSLNLSFKQEGIICAAKKIRWFVDSSFTSATLSVTDGPRSSSKGLSSESEADPPTACSPALLPVSHFKELSFFFLFSAFLCSNQWPLKPHYNSGQLLIDTTGSLQDSS